MTWRRGDAVWLLYVATVLSLGLVVANCLASASRPADVNNQRWVEPIDVLEWVSDVRSSVTDGVLTVDNSDSDAGYSYNIGPIAVSGRISVTLSLAGSSGPLAALALAGRLSPPDGPWWAGLEVVYIAFGGGDVQIQVKNGLSEEGIARIPLGGLDMSQPFSLVFADGRGTALSVEQNGKILQGIDLAAPGEAALPGGLFASGWLHVGTLLGPRSVLRVGGLALRQMTASRTATAQPQPPALRDLAAQRGIDIGCQGLYEHLNNLTYARLLAGEFDRMTVDFLWAYDRPSRDRFDFRRTERLVDFARKHNMRVQGLHLVWGSPQLLPDWLKQGSFTRDEAIAILRDHVLATVGRYKGLVQTWVVVNEALNEDDFWRRAIGPDYVAMAFRWAREADPEAVLLYNDYDNEVANRRSDAIYQMIAQMQQESAPIDGVGMQMHLLNPDSPYQTPHNKADVVATMRRFGRLGMQVHVTEFDVFLAGQPGTQQEKWAFQAAVYRDMLGACLESGVCRSFSVYGLSDAVSWYLAGHANPEPLLFDADYEPKPAYWSVRGVLSRNPSP